jgi:hypothetical protein
MLPKHLYSALIGLLVNQGTNIIESSRPEWYPEQKRLRFSSVDSTFLEFLQGYFAPYFRYGVNEGITRLSNKNFSLQTMNSNLTMHLYKV